MADSQPEGPPPPPPAEPHPEDLEAERLARERAQAALERDRSHSDQPQDGPRNDEDKGRDDDRHPDRREHHHDDDRDRDRDRSRRTRSRSRGQDRRRSRSRSRDRDRRRDRHAGGRHKGPKRKRPSKYWDKAPEGYDHLSPMQYKALADAGSLPPPPGTAPVLPPGAIPSIMPGGQPGQEGAFQIAPGGPMPQGAPLQLVPPGQMPIAENPAARQARRLYVGGIPFGITEPEMVQFFNQEMLKHSLNTAPGFCVLSAQVNTEKNFAFLEFRTPEETTHCMQLDGIILNGQSLKLRRPKDYVPPIEQAAKIENPNRIYMGNIPKFLQEDQIREIIQAFGEIKTFHLVKNPATAESEGYAFFEFKDPSLTDAGIENLNGFEIGEDKLEVKRASGSESVPGVRTGIAFKPTRVLALMNMVTEAELQDDEEFEDIKEDVREECSKFGAVNSIKIPRPIEGKEVLGLGKVFVEFADTDGTQRANAALSGRKFANRTVVTAFFNEDDYAADRLL